MASALSNRRNCACARKHEDGRTAPGVCGNGSVPLSHSGNVVTRIGIHTHLGNGLFTDGFCVCKGRPTLQMAAAAG